MSDLSYNNMTISGNNNITVAFFSSTGCYVGNVTQTNGSTASSASSATSATSAAGSTASGYTASTLDLLRSVLLTSDVTVTSSSNSSLLANVTTSTDLSKLFEFDTSDTIKTIKFTFLKPVVLENIKLRTNNMSSNVNIGDHKFAVDNDNSTVEDTNISWANDERHIVKEFTVTVSSSVTKIYDIQVLGSIFPLDEFKSKMSHANILSEVQSVTWMKPIVPILNESNNYTFEILEYKPLNNNFAPFPTLAWDNSAGQPQKLFYPAAEYCQSLRIWGFASLGGLFGLPNILDACGNPNAFTTDVSNGVTTWSDTYKNWLDNSYNDVTGTEMIKLRDLYVKFLFILIVVMQLESAFLSNNNAGYGTTYLGKVFFEPLDFTLIQEISGNLNEILPSNIKSDISTSLLELTKTVTSGLVNWFIDNSANTDTDVSNAYHSVSLNVQLVNSPLRLDFSWITEQVVAHMAATINVAPNNGLSSDSISAINDLKDNWTSSIGNNFYPLNTGISLPYTVSSKKSDGSPSGVFPYGYHICGATKSLIDYMQQINLSNGQTYADTEVGGRILKLCYEILSMEVEMLKGKKIWETAHWKPDLSYNPNTYTGTGMVKYIYEQCAEVMTAIGNTSPRLESLMGNVLITINQELYIIIKFLQTLILHLNTIKAPYLSGIPNLEFLIYASLGGGPSAGANWYLNSKKLTTDKDTGQQVSDVSSNFIFEDLTIELASKKSGTFLRIADAALVEGSNVPFVNYGDLGPDLMHDSTKTGILSIYEDLRANPSLWPAQFQ